MAFTLLNKFWFVPWPKKILLLQACIIACLVRGALFLTSLKRITSYISSRFRKLQRNDSVSAEDIIMVIKVVGRYLPFATCLVNGLSAQYLFGHYGIRSKLVIGVKKVEGGTLDAHAWVTIDDEVVLGEVEDLASYTSLMEPKV